MRLISWNVNGLRAVLRKNFYAFLQEYDPDILCLQETKVNDDMLPDVGLPQYGYRCFHCAQKRGYSGTAVFSKERLLDVNCYCLPETTLNLQEGRLILAQLERFWLLNVYTPNSKENLSRLEMRFEGWDKLMAYLMKDLKSRGSVIVCGDFNVAHEEADLASPTTNKGHSGFTDQERAGFARYLSLGFVDAFRQFHPNEKDAYSYWSYRLRARAKNAGWRIDYFLISSDLLPLVNDCRILSDVEGSDHAPILLDLAIDAKKADDLHRLFSPASPVAE